MSNAQAYYESNKHKFGIKLGTQFTMLSGGLIESPKPRITLTAGALYKYKLSNQFHLMTELDFSIKGSNYYYGDRSLSQLSLLYIDLPVFLAYDLVPKKHDHTVLMGVQGSYLLSSSVFKNDEPFSPNMRDTTGLKKYDIGISVGYQKHFEHVGIQFILKLGLIDINNTFKLNNTFVKPTIGDGKLTNNAIEISFTF